MQFRIADTFTDSLAKLTGEEQKNVKITVFDLQASPAGTGLQLHKLDGAKDRNFWSVRVNRDVRLIVHKTPASMLVCYVDHHDDAYRWAERRKLEIHPKTGAAQFVVIREMVLEIPVRKAVEGVAEITAPVAKPKLFANHTDAELLAYGVPRDWLVDVRAADEDTVLDVATYLPGEAAEALLQIATGGVVLQSAPEGYAAHMETPHVASEAVREAATVNESFAHPDAQRRFLLIENREELERALDYPWDKWTTFLHPAQRDIVERSYNGPARVSGSAGTGKTIVALHRAAHLARKHPEVRVLLGTFSDTLAHALRTKLRRLIGNEPRLAERIDVHSLDSMGLRLHKAHIGPARLAARNELTGLLREAAEASTGHKFSPRFLFAEWEQIIDAWQLSSWEAYRDVPRLGRKTRLAEAQRRVLWSIFEHVHAGLKQRGLTTHAAMFTALATALPASRNPPFDFAVIDESQDISVAQLRFLAALGRGRANALFFAGDLGQRIFQQPFSWKSLGVDVRGRSRTLRVNYRTSHQIRAHADRLLEPEVTDVDGNREDRGCTISVFNGTPPAIIAAATQEQEAAAVGEWLRERVAEGVLPHEIAVFVRSAAEMPRAQQAAEAARLRYKVLDERVETTSGYASLCTMHLAKGLEFRAVSVMACDDEVIPSQERIEAIGDDADLREIYDTERQLLYVACTRARDYLLVTSVEPPSEFLDDLRKA